MVGVITTLMAAAGGRCQVHQIRYRDVMPAPLVVTDSLWLEWSAALGQLWRAGSDQVVRLSSLHVGSEFWSHTIVVVMLLPI